MAAKSNTSALQIDKSSFFWVGNCGICHPGGGPAEFDRFGQRYFDPRTGQWGYEVLGRSAAEVGLDGDYTFAPGSGVARPAGHPTPPAEWNKTWVSEPDCLFCHASKRVLDGQANRNWIWRTATLKGMANLRDSDGAVVHSYLAAAAAGQGWFANLELAPTVPGNPPVATKLDLSYRAGVTNGDLVADADGHAAMPGRGIAKTPRDAACWGCHATPDLKKRGRVWFDADKDVHYRAFTRRNDADATNDVPAAEAQACTVCHPADYHHEIAKGDPFEGSVAAERNYRDFLSCRECHADGNAFGAPVPAGGDFHRQGHLDKLACQVCHIPHKEASAQLVVDNAATGVSLSFDTNQFLSADPDDPQNPDKSRWYPSLHLKADSDGVERLFLAKLLNVTWWGAWYHGPDGVANTADDYVRPVPLWRIRKVTGGQALPGATDDNGDGTVEVNRPDEIRLYIDQFRAEPSATPPGLGLAGPDDPDDYALIKGDKFWWLDEFGVVQTFALHAPAPGQPATEVVWLGAKVESAVPFAIDHNVLPKGAALRECVDCHVAPAQMLIGRKVLVDPFGPDAQATPIYREAREILAREGYVFLAN